MKRKPQRLVTIDIQVNPAISGGARTLSRLSRHSGSWTQSMQETFEEAVKEAERRFGNGGARVVVKLNGDEVQGLMVGERF